jgi:hypothetical protein
MIADMQRFPAARKGPAEPSLFKVSCSRATLRLEQKQERAPGGRLLRSGLTNDAVVPVLASPPIARRAARDSVASSMSTEDHAGSNIYDLVNYGHAPLKVACAADIRDFGSSTRTTRVVRSCSSPRRRMQPRKSNKSLYVPVVIYILR